MIDKTIPDKEFISLPDPQSQLNLQPTENEDVNKVKVFTQSEHDAQTTTESEIVLGTPKPSFTNYNDKKTNCSDVIIPESTANNSSKSVSKYENKTTVQNTDRSTETAVNLFVNFFFSNVDMYDNGGRHAQFLELARMHKKFF